MNPLSKFVSFIICLLVIFYFPLSNTLQKQDAITQTYVTETVAEFTSNVRNHGYISSNMYFSFIQKLDATSNLYNVDIKHSHKIVIPLYDDDLVFLDDYETTYVDTFEDEIFNTLESGENYFFKQGDYISVKISNRNATIASKLRNFVTLGNNEGIEILGLSGGMIRDEVE